MRISAPVETFHNLTVLRMPELARVLPSGLNVTDITYSECVRERNSAPVETSRSLMVRSSLPLARIFPSGLKATVLTGAGLSDFATGGAACLQPAGASASQSTVKVAAAFQFAFQFVRDSIVIDLVPET